LSTRILRPTTGTYLLDRSNSTITVVARSAFIKVRVSFQEFHGTGYFDADDPTRSRLELTIGAGSIDSGNTRRDAHLRSDAYLDDDDFPRITFLSTAVTQTDDQRYSVIGDLVIKDVTKPVTVDLTLTAVAPDALGRHRVELKGSADIDRSRWDVTWNRVLEGYGIFVGLRVTTAFNMTAISASSG